MLLVVKTMRILFRTKRFLLLSVSLCIVGTFVPFAAQSAESNDSETMRPSSAAFESLWGRDAYRFNQLSGVFAVDRKWVFKADLTKIRYAQESRTTEIRIGADVDSSPIFSFRGSIFGRQEPNEIQATGFSGGITYEISSAWRAEKPMHLDLDAEFFRYGQSGDRPGGRALGSTIFGRMIHVGLTQSVDDAWSVGADLTFYSYGGKARFERLSRATNDRRFSQSRMAILMPNYVENIMAVNGVWSPHENVDVKLELSSTRVFNRSTRTSGQELDLTYRLGRRWSLASINGLSQTRNNDGMSFVGGFEVEYSW